MSLQELNFRATAGYRTDDSVDAHIVTSSNGAYPVVTAQGFTVGWTDTANVSRADRSLTIDPRLAGVHSLFWSAPTRSFRVTLPSAGLYNVRLAAGNTSFTHVGKVDLFDNLTAVTTLASQGAAPGNWVDALNTIYSAADWPANNAAYQHSFVSTDAYFELAHTTGASGNRFLAHISLESVAGGINLSGDAQSSAQATGALTSQIPLTGASVVVATATGALSVPIELAGAAAVISMSGGELTAQITLSGAATAQALSNAGLDTSILFAGDAISSASASGDLTTGSGLSGDASAQSVAAASITTQIQLSASAVAQALAIGDLSVPTSGLSGDAASTSDASGILSTNILLAGDASAQVTGAGDLNTQIPLDGVAVNLISVTGDLTASITFSGTAAVLVLAGADLTTQIPLSADALSQALATGFLTSGDVVTLKNPKYTVAAQARDYTVTDARDYRVSA